MRGVWVGPTKGRLFKFDFPSADFWVRMFLGLRAKRPPPPSRQAIKSNSDGS